MKSFNTTAICVPSKHYMVDLAAKVEEIRALVDEGKYFYDQSGKAVWEDDNHTCALS